MANLRVCSIPDCGKPVRARMFCRCHYERFRKYGNPMSGKAFPGQAKRYYEEVVLGYEGDECLTWPFGTNRGYGQFWTDGRSQYVSRLVCAATHGEPPTPKHEAAHSCGNGHLGCVAKRHLRWATSKENKADKVLHGTTNRGERQGIAKLTRSDVRIIRSLRGQKRLREIGDLFGVSIGAIASIYNGSSWAWLD